MKKLAFFCALLTLIIPHSLFAAEFNPNFIISDEELQDAVTMSRSDIQTFLVDNGGYISRLTTEDWEGIRKTAAEIIYDAAQDSKINPKYLLVKLQKEQSLVTDPDPTQKQLDWATGYGVCDSCSMDDPSIQKYRGFGTQVDRAAGIMRWYYDNVQSQNWIKKAQTSYTIDGTEVRPVSFATAFLYTYTPHLHGNENFWKLWQKWFDQVYPEGTLIKSSSEPTVYVIQDGKRRPFKNMTALVTRYNPNFILTAPESEITRYSLGSPISLANYSIAKDGSNYYLLDYDYKRKFESADTIKSLGYHPDEIIEVTNADLAGYVDGPMISSSNTHPFGRLIRLKENGELYHVQDGTYHSIADVQISQINFPNLTIENGSIADLSSLQRGEPVMVKNGILFGIKGLPEIFVVENGERRHIASESVFHGLGYKSQNIVWVNEYVGASLENGQALYLRDAGEPSSSTTSNDTTNTSVEETINPVEYMVRTPADRLSYIGAPYTTDIDSYLIADNSTGEILAGKNVDTVRPMASLAKVMTGYQLIFDGLNLEKTTTYNPLLHKASYDNFRIVEGEVYHNGDLMNAMLVSSLNTPSRTLVNSESNQEESFIARMNTHITSWGLSNTLFKDINGLDSNTLTTSKEYTILFSNVVKNSILREYLGAPSYRYTEVVDKDGKPDHFDTHSNELVTHTNLPYTILASKTGFTYDAGANLAMLVKRKVDGKEFIIIMLGNPDYGTHTRFNAPADLAQWAMANL